MTSVPQLRAARALLGWSQDRLAEASGVSKPTIARLELGTGELGGYAGTRDKIQSALQSAGVIFVEENGEGPGVRLRKAGKAAKSLVEAGADAERIAATVAHKTKRMIEGTERSIDETLDVATATQGAVAASRQRLQNGKRTDDHPKPTAPASEAVEKM